jgi:hypothetical protein
MDGPEDTHGPVVLHLRLPICLVLTVQRSTLGNLDLPPTHSTIAYFPHAHLIR